MNKFLAFLREAFNYVNKLKESNPLTLIGIIIGTAFGIVNVLNDITYLHSGLYTIAVWGTVASCLFVLGSFVFESFKVSSSLKSRIIFFAIWTIISVLWAVTFYDVYSLLKWDEIIENSIGEERLSMLNIGLILFLVCLGIYFNYKNRCKESFSRYLAKAFGKCFISGVICIVIIIGVFFLSWMVDEFIYSNSADFILLPLMVLVFGLYFVPSVVSAFANENEEEPALIKVLIKYIMLVLCILAYVIIYAYILKIVILWKIPSNSIYATLTALFVVSILESYFCTSYEKDSFLQKMAYAMPIAFTPFLFLQSYAAIIRVVQHGFTPARYFGLLFIAVEIVYIIVYFTAFFRKKNPDMSIMVLIIAGFILVGGILPKTNGLDFSRSMSIHSVKAYIRNRGYEKSEEMVNYHSRNASAISYLYSHESEEKIRERFDENEIEIIRSIKPKFLKEKKDEREVSHIKWKRESGSGFDVSPYQSMHEFYYLKESRGSVLSLETPELDTSSLTLVLDDDMSQTVQADLEEYIRKEVDGNDTLEGCVSISDSTDLLITDFDITYDINTKEIMKLSLYGFLFTK